MHLAQKTQTKRKQAKQAEPKEKGKRKRSKSITPAPNLETLVEIQFKEQNKKEERISYAIQGDK